MDGVARKATVTHSMERTSPMGERFVGRCVLCGQVGLTTANMGQICPNPGGTTQEQALLGAIEGPRK